MVLARLFEFDGSLLVRAIHATFARRRTPLPEGLPVALRPGFAEDASKKGQWAGFVRKTAAPDAGDLKDSVVAIAAFVEQPLAAAAHSAFAARWPPGGPWRSKGRATADLT